MTELLFLHSACRLMLVDTCIKFREYTGDKNISILHSPCRTSDLQFSLVLQTHALVLKKCMGGDVFEVPYITAKIIFTHCSQFHNCIPYTDKKSFTYNTQSHVATFFSKNRVSARDILAELQPSRRKFNNYSDTVCQTYFIDENTLQKNQYLLRYSLPHYRALYCAVFIRHLQSQHPVSTFGIEKVCGSMKTLSAIQKMLVSPADFSTRPEGRALWEDSLVLSKIHS